MYCMWMRSAIDKFIYTNMYILLHFRSDTQKNKWLEILAEKYQLHHFQVGQVKDEQVSVPMGIQTFPTCFVYSESGNFIKQFKGQVKMDVITDLF